MDRNYVIFYVFSEILIIGQINYYKVPGDNLYRHYKNIQTPAVLTNKTNDMIIWDIFQSYMADTCQHTQKNEYLSFH